MMKLSEAIRLGAMWKPQARGELFKKTGRTCALGAALEAFGVTPVSAPAGGIDTRGNPITSKTMIEWHWPKEIYKTLDRVVGSPCKCQLVARVRNVIPHLNDWHHWTRERIADWVATVEPQEQPASVEVHAEKVQV